MSQAKRIFLVEDHPVFRFGLRELLNKQEDLEVCGEAEEVSEALKEIEKSLPDMVLVDLSLHGRSGIELIKEIRSRHRDMPVLVVSMYDEAHYAERALSAGARGYIMKRETSNSIVTAVRRVLDGKVYLSERIMADIMDQLVGGGKPGEMRSMDKLTDRELEVFQLIGKGLTTGEIATRLNLSVNTIGTYRDRIKEKLNLKTASELISYAVRWCESD